MRAVHIYCWNLFFWHLLPDVKPLHPHPFPELCLFTGLLHPSQPYAENSGSPAHLGLINPAPLPPSTLHSPSATLGLASSSGSLQLWSFAEPCSWAPQPIRRWIFLPRLPLFDSVYLSDVSGALSALVSLPCSQAFPSLGFCLYIVSGLSSYSSDSFLLLFFRFCPPSFLLSIFSGRFPSFSWFQLLSLS